jgi:hypothetical protein
MLKVAEFSRKCDLLGRLNIWRIKPPSPPYYSVQVIDIWIIALCSDPEFCLRQYS